jgi:mannose-6-phosphate isomerase-like protein (cupin superfamily)
MPLNPHADLPRHTLPGLEHRTVAGPEHGMRQAEVWLQTMAPGAGTPVHRHDCEEAIVILEGSGTCTIGEETIAFGPDSTLIIPRDAVHQLVNTGDVPIRLIGVLAAAPVAVRTAEGAPLPLPWQA